MANIRTKIGDIRRKLDICISLRNAQDSAARVYDDAEILVNSAKNAMEEAEKIMADTAASLEAAAEAKEAALASLKTHANDLMAVIKNSRKRGKGNDRATNQKKPVSGPKSVLSALDACLQTRESVNEAAVITKEAEIIATSAAEKESLIEAALSASETAWLEKVRIYEEAVAAADAARASMIEAATIAK